MEDKIREAYEGMAPTPEQEQRMLNALLETQAQGQAPAEGASTPKPKQARRKTFTAFKVIAPLAACLVVGAIVFGVGSTAPSPEPAAKTESATAVSTADTTEGGVQAMTYEQNAIAADGYAPETPPTTIMPVEPDHFNTEEYAAVDENGFVSTVANPLSTVSADVDTASYANLRRMVAQGNTIGDIPSGAVRVEEMLNYFGYDYARPDGTQPFSIQAQASTCPWNPDTQLLVLGFATPYEADAAKAGANLVFLIDVSGSMNSPDKLELLQDSFATLLESCDANDRISIVTYSGHEEVVLEGASGDDEAAIMKAIYRLHASGSTNGEAGLRMAYEVAERNYIQGGVNRIVMASDGDLNVGMTSESDLYDFVSEKRESGIYLSVLGFGSGNYKDTKMEVLADHGNGSYHYIDCVAEADRVLKDRLMANLVPFADDVKVQVEFNPSQVKAYRLIGYENRALADEDFLNDEVDAGDVGPNSQFTVAYEIVPADSSYEVSVPDLKYGSTSYAGNASSDWLTCSIRYRMFSDGQVHAQDMAVDAGNATANPTDDWRFAGALIEFAMLATDSNYKGTSSMESVLNTLDGMHLNDERAGFRKLVQTVAENQPVSSGSNSIDSTGAIVDDA